MPRLFTALEMPADIGERLALLRGGLSGARWIDPANYHVTLRFIGDVDYATARDVASLLAEARHAQVVTLSFDALGSFGGDRPRSLFARVAPNADLVRLQAEQERLVRRAGIPPESRKFTPHMTLARLRDVRAGDVAAYLARNGVFPRLAFTAERFVIYSSRDSVGGGPYVVEAAYPLRPAPEARTGQAPGDRIAAWRPAWRTA